KFAADLFLFLAENSAGKFPEDSKNRRKQLPTKVLAGNLNPQEIPRIFGPNPQDNQQENNKFLVVIVEVSELLYLDVSRFQTLFVVALELEKEVNGHTYPYYFWHFSKADSTTVRELVKLHRAGMAQNQVTTVRRMPSVPGI
ncbi:hypothetical protein A2U01_0042059, partial [Trifolium medium]|nr:hypothetical protein [Trifolium medium]